MGYCTDYSLEVKELGSHTFKELDAAIEEMNSDLESIDWGGEHIWQNSSQPITWYDHEEDMGKLSRQFPDIIFALSGIGDSPEDMWKKYFLRGLIQRTRAKIIYDEFDEIKLHPQDMREEPGDEA